MKSNDLLSLLSRLESTLADFSFEELSSEEASHLKISFQRFKGELEGKVYGDDSSNKASSVDADQNGISNTPANENSLIANLGHEIRTPLNGIIGFTDLLKESGLDKDQLINVNAIQTASYTLLETVNELLEYSKLASGKEQFQKMEFNVFRLVRDVMYLCNTLITKKKVTLTSEIAQDIPELLVGDPSRLTQVLLNVIGNAINFANEGEVALNVHQAGTLEGGLLLEFEVKDEVNGAVTEKGDRIFDPFKEANADTASKYGSTGLGLSVVKQIVENLGGSLNLKSNLGFGTAFKFTMPFGKCEREPKTMDLSQKKENPENSNLVAGSNILVFEDNVLNQRLIEQRLKMWRCHMHITDNPEYGLDVLESNEIDLVLMDLRMPIMSGFKITRLIRNNNNPRINRVPIIALTADYTIRDQEKCRSYGINDYLLKPFSPGELLSKLVAYRNPMDNSQPSESIVQNTQKTDKGKLVDLTQLFDDSEGDIAVLEDLVFLFKNNIVEFIAKAENQLSEEDSEGLAFSSHKLKAGLAMIKANGLLKIVVEIQNVCKELPDWKHLDFLFARFVNDYPALERAVDKAVEGLKR